MLNKSKTSGRRAGLSAYGTGKTGFIYEISKNRWLYLLMLPGILFFILFNYLPIGGLYIAFTKFNVLKGIFGSEFVGFSNFRFFFTSNDWLLVVLNTLYLNALFILSGLIVQVFLAIALSEISGVWFKKVMQTFMFLPNFISWTVVSIMALALFATDEGMVNSVLAALGFQKISFFQDGSVWPVVLVILRLWKSAGFGTVIYLATIAGIEQEMYEAAKIDGASRLQSIRHITIPMLRTTMVMLTILAIGGIFHGDFGMIYAIVGDNPLLKSSTDVIDTFVYRALRRNNDFGMSSAVGLFQSVVGFIMVFMANSLTKKIDRESSLF